MERLAEKLASKGVSAHGQRAISVDRSGLTTFTITRSRAGRVGGIGSLSDQTVS